MLRSLMIATLFSTSATAECPKPADMSDAGIMIGLTDGSATTITQGEVPGQTRERTIFVGNPDALVLEALGGVLPLRSHQERGTEALPGSHNQTDWSAPETLFPLKDGALLTLEGMERPSGRPSTSVRVTVGARAARSLTWAGCTVTAMPVTLTYRYPSGSGERTLLEYLPDFGISVYIGGGALDEDPWRYDVTDFKRADE